MRLALVIATALLSGCTSFPVGSAVVCIMCKVTVHAPPPQTAADKIGSGLVEILAGKVAKRGHS